MREAPTLPGVPPAGTYATHEVAALTGIHTSSLNRLALFCGWAKGSGVPLRWSRRDVQALRIALAIEAAGAGDSFPVIARDVFACGGEPLLAGWVAYRRGIVRYGATPSEALGPLLGAVLAWLKPDPKEHL